MAEAFVYIVASAGPDPDRITKCAVPWRVDDQEIFFGPCKKRIREELRSRFLSETVDDASPDEDIYLVGLNPSNASGRRTVLWAGRVARVMTYQRAHEVLAGPRYAAMRSNAHSPLHVTPIIEEGDLVGYAHNSLQHAKGDAWVLDLVKRASDGAVAHIGDRLMLADARTDWDGFPRDVCFLLENLFFATGRAIDVDEEAADIFRQAQPDVADVNPYAVFGYRRDGSVNGLTGSSLKLESPLADQLVDWIRTRFREHAIR